MSKYSLFDALNAKKFDKRLTDWNVQQGIVTKQEVQSNISQLADDTDNKVDLNIKEDSKKEEVQEDTH